MADSTPYGGFVDRESLHRETRRCNRLVGRIHGVGVGASLEVGGRGNGGPNRRPRSSRQVPGFSERSASDARTISDVGESLGRGDERPRRRGVPGLSAHDVQFRIRGGPGPSWSRCPNRPRPSRPDRLPRIGGVNGDVRSCSASGR